jgi:hypothetical protein
MEGMAHAGEGERRGIGWPLWGGLRRRVTERATDRAARRSRARARARARPLSRPALSAPTAYVCI